MTTVEAGVVRTPRSEPESGPYAIGLLAILATVAMLFAAFTAAFLIRRTGPDWVALALPPVVGVNTLVLVLSSVAAERARLAVGPGGGTAIAGWLAAALALGVLFLVGQLAAWWSLVQAGVFLPSNPNASFFYMLTAVHGVHVVGGVFALIWVLMRSRSSAYTEASHAGLTHAVLFWHFMGAIWLYLLVLLTLA
jgi:cytochrome c oxidase subunit 3